MLTLLEQVRKLPELQQRKVSCLLGAAVADAAARPLHWIYDLGELNAAIKSDPEHPEFWPESKSPFYSIPTGENSSYFDEALAALTSLANRGEFDFEDVCEEFSRQLGPGSQYDAEKREDYMLRRRLGQPLVPLQGKWLSGSMVKCLENRRKGAQLYGDPHIKETDGFCASLPLVVKYAGQPGMLDKVMKVTTTQSTWPVAVRHALVASRLVEAFLLLQPAAKSEGVVVASVKEAIKGEFPEIHQEFGIIESQLSTPHTQAVGMVFGRPCYNPGSFMGAIHAVLTSQSYAEAVRKTIRAGGCNCSRSLFIGAMMGARDGLEAIPEDWILRTTSAETVLRLAIKIAA